MNVEVWIAKRLLWSVTVWTLVVPGTASADSLIDQLLFPLADPLLARPPRADAGAMLPGDSHALDCRGLEQIATPQSPLTLADAVGLAVCHHPAVRSARAEIGKQAAQVGEARAAYLPTITVGASRLNQKNSYPETRFTVTSAQTRSSEYATLTWRLLDFGARDGQRKSADALLEAALASHDAQLQKTIADMTGAYFDAQTARAALDARDKHRSLARQTLETAKKREARGAGARSDILQADTALAKAELDHSRAAGAFEKSKAMVVLALGLPAQSNLARRLELAADDGAAIATLERDLDSWLALAAGQHPALLAARAQTQAAREKLRIIRSEGLPTVDFTQSRYLNGRPSQGLSSTRSTESVVGVTVNFPLFEGFSRTYRMRGQEAQIEARQAQLQDTENQILSEVVKAHADATVSLQNLTFSRRLTAAAQAAMADVRLRFERGIADILDLLSAQKAQADAEQEALRSQAEWRSARLRLLASSGVIGGKDVANE